MPSRCRSLCSTDEFSSLESSRLFVSHLAPVIAADGPGSSHPPSSSDGMVSPLIWMIPFLSQGSLWPIFLATPRTALGDLASPWPAPYSSPCLSALAFSWPLPPFLCLGHWTGTLPSLMDSYTSMLSYQLDLSPGREHRDVQ